VFCARHEGTWGHTGTAPLLRNIGTRLKWMTNFTHRPPCPQEINPITHRIWGLVLTAVCVEIMEKGNTLCHNRESQHRSSGAQTVAYFLCVPENRVGYVWTLDISTLRHGRPNGLWQRATPVLKADSRAACEIITVSGKTNRLNYCVIFIVYTQFINMASDHTLENHALRYTVKPAYNGNPRNRLFFFCSQVPFQTGNWNTNPRNSRSAVL
jgi:hypothetical protein